MANEAPLQSLITSPLDNTVKQLIPTSVFNSGRRRWIAALLLTASIVSGGSLLAQSPAKVKRKVLTQVAPEYPYVLRNGHFEGQVKLAATVLPNGSVTKVEPLGGNPMLSQYAQEAVMRWKFAPGSAQTVEEVVFTFNSNK